MMILFFVPEEMLLDCLCNDEYFKEMSLYAFDKYLLGTMTVERSAKND